MCMVSAAPVTIDRSGPIAGAINNGTIPGTNAIAILFKLPFNGHHSADQAGTIYIRWRVAARILLHLRMDDLSQSGSTLNNFAPALS